MKRIFLLLTLLCAFVAARPVDAQYVQAGTLWYYSWPAATTTGQVGQYLIMATPLQSGGAADDYTVYAYVTGTVPTTCTFEVEISPDAGGPNNNDWSTGTNSVTGPQTCASATTLPYSVAFKPGAYLRINLTTLSGGDGTTKVYFFYTRGRNAQ